MLCMQVKWKTRSVRGIVYIESNETAHLVNASQLVTFSLTAEKSQIVAQLAMLGIICCNLVYQSGNPPPTILLRFESMSHAATIPMLGVGESRCTGCFLLMEVQPQMLTAPT
jgi:hypothetical protein